MLRKKTIYITTLLWSLLMLAGNVLPCIAQNRVAVADTVIRGEDDPDSTYSLEEEEIDTEGDFVFSYTEMEEGDAVAPSARRIADKGWQKLLDDPDFDYKKPEQKIEKEPKEPSWFSRMLYRLLAFLAGPYGRLLLWVLLGATVVLVVWWIIRKNGLQIWRKKDKKLHVSGTADELADDFIPESWEDIIRKAEQAGNYRLAIRHSYRHILYRLDEQEMIVLNPTTSNYQYRSQMRQSAPAEVSGLFNRLLHHYEFAWYGGFEVSAAHYERIRSLYHELKHKI